MVWLGSTAAPGSRRGGAGALDLDQLLIDAGAGLIDRRAKFVQVWIVAVSPCCCSHSRGAAFPARGANALVLIAVMASISVFAVRTVLRARPRRPTGG